MHRLEVSFEDFKVKNKECLHFLFLDLFSKCSMKENNVLKEN